MKDHSASGTGRRRNARVTLAVALGAGFLLVGVAVATPGIGILSAPVHARGTLAEHQVVNSKSGVHLNTKGSVDVATQQIVIAGGGSTGWHSHPGPVLVTVKPARSGSSTPTTRPATAPSTRRVTASSTVVTPSRTSRETCHRLRTSSSGRRTSCPALRTRASETTSHRRPATADRRAMPPGRQEGALFAAGRRPLRRVQRLALPLRNSAAHFRLHPVAQRTTQGGEAQAARRGVAVPAWAVGRANGVRKCRCETRKAAAVCPPSLLRRATTRTVARASGCRAGVVARPAIRQVETAPTKLCDAGVFARLRPPHPHPPQSAASPQQHVRRAPPSDRRARSRRRSRRRPAASVALPDRPDRPRRAARAVRETRRAARP